MRPRGFLLLCAAFAVVGVLGILWSNRDMPVTLPNGFVLKGRNLLSADFRSVLAADIEFVCFDDRFLVVISKTRGQSGLFDAETRNKIPWESHPEIYQPGGLKYGQACNGYYTAMVGPGLLGGGPAPFLPSCSSINHKNPTLRDQSWLDRPCAER